MVSPTPTLTQTRTRTRTQTLTLSLTRTRTRDRARTRTRTRTRTQTQIRARTLTLILSLSLSLTRPLALSLSLSLTRPLALTRCADRGEPRQPAARGRAHLRRVRALLAARHGRRLPARHRLGGGLGQGRGWGWGSGYRAWVRGSPWFRVGARGLEGYPLTLSALVLQACPASGPPNPYPTPNPLNYP